MKTPVLSQIIIYPVKSLGGFSVDAWEVNEKGLLYDRKWMLVDEQEQFLSQRRLPKMALIKTAIREDKLILSTANKEDLILELNPDATEIISTTIWDDVCDGQCVSVDADQWLSEILEMKCRLVYQAEKTVRAVDPDYANSKDKVNFSDGFPFLLLSQASLEHLKLATGLELSILRFRPNLVIAQCDAYAEDLWREIKIGEIDFRLPKPCSRCSVPAINPVTAETAKEPLKTLARLRQWQHKIYFGQNALHNTVGRLQINDKVEIKRISTPQPPL